MASRDRVKHHRGRERNIYLTVSVRKGLFWIFFFWRIKDFCHDIRFVYVCVSIEWKSEIRVVQWNGDRLLRELGICTQRLQTAAEELSLSKMWDIINFSEANCSLVLRVGFVICGIQYHLLYSLIATSGCWIFNASTGCCFHWEVKVWATSISW